MKRKDSLTLHVENEHDLISINKVPTTTTFSIQRLHSQYQREGLKSPTRIVCTPSTRRYYSRQNSLTTNQLVTAAVNDTTVSSRKEVPKLRGTRGAEVSTAQFSQINSTLQISFNINDIRRKLSPTMHATKRTSNKLEFFNTSIATEKSATVGDGGKEFDPVENRLINELFSDDENDREISQYKEDMGDLKLRNNLQSRILREHKDTFFNKSMMRFNSRKNSKDRDDSSQRQSNDDDVKSEPAPIMKNRPSVAYESNLLHTFQQNTTHANAEFSVMLNQKTLPLENEIESELRVTFHLADQNQDKEISNSKALETNSLNESQDSEKTCVRECMPKIDSKVKKSILVSSDTTVMGMLRVLNDDKYNFEKLLKLIYMHDWQGTEVFLNRCATPEDLNKKDGLGNTPLMLTAKLNHTHPDYYRIAQLLMKHGADPSIRDINGWSCIDEAVCQADTMFLNLAFDYLLQRKRRMFSKQEKQLKNMLEKTPDFYVEMKWDFDSSVIPFLSKLAPNDTCKIWKYKNKIRLDNTLASLKRLKCKRRDMSLIVNTKEDRHMDHYPELYSLNRTKKQYTNLLEGIDPDEKRLVIRDLLRADPLQGVLELKSCTCTESKNWLGSKVTQRINEWETKKLEFKLEFDYSLFKKSKALFKMPHDEYVRLLKIEEENQKQRKLEEEQNNSKPEQQRASSAERISPNQTSKLKGQASNPILHPKLEKPAAIQARSQSVKTRIENIMSNKEKITVNIKTKEDAKTTTKKQNAYIWVAEKFPISFKAIHQALSFLSKGNKILGRLQEVLNCQEVQNILKTGGFPVKLQIPLTLSVKANITFTKFELIKNKDLDHMFEIPKDFTYTERKVIQKTMERPKKRMVLVNLLI